MKGSTMDAMRTRNALAFAAAPTVVACSHGAGLLSDDASARPATRVPERFVTVDPLTPRPPAAGPRTPGGGECGRMGVWRAGGPGMIAKRLVEEFVAQEALALVGVSRSGKGFGNAALGELAANGYRVHPVHPSAEAVQGLACAPDLASVSEPVGGVVVVVPPEQTEKVVCEAAAAGIRRVWMQQGSESPAAIAYCAANGIDAVHGECILMYLRRGPAIHRFHRGLRRLFGRLPR